MLPVGHRCPRSRFARDKCVKETLRKETHLNVHPHQHINHNRYDKSEHCYPTLFWSILNKLPNKQQFLSLDQLLLFLFSIIGYCFRPSCVSSFRLMANPFVRRGLLAIVPDWFIKHKSSLLLRKIVFSDWVYLWSLPPPCAGGRNQEVVRPSVRSLRWLP